MYEAGNGHEFRVHKVEPRFDEWAAHGQPTSGLWDYELDKKIVHVFWLELCGIVMSSSELICMLVD